MRFGILGPLQVEVRGGPAPVLGARPRMLLIVLILHANEVVSVDRLIDVLWGERPPSGARHAVHQQVLRVRHALADRIAPNGDVVLTRAPGYLIRIGPDDLDMFVFERLTGEGRRLLEAGDPVEAAGVLRRALDLWRGPPLPEFATEDFALPMIQRLEELRLEAIEDRVEADLALGRHTEVVGELRSIVAADPLRERPSEQLMLALYRSGRQAEALAAARDTRRILADELGVDPGPSLQRLEQAILRQDPSLEGPPRSDEAPQATGLDVRKMLAVVAVALELSPEPGGPPPDPDAFRVRSEAVVRLVRDAIERHGGTVAEAAGAVLGLFGVPRLHEDDAARALLSAWDIAAASRAASERGEGRRPGEAVHVAVRAGEVVLPSGRIQTEDLAAAAGPVVSAALDLAGHAPSGVVLLDEAARGMVRGTLRVARAPRGLRLLAPPAPPRPRPGRWMTPLVGRTAELHALREALALATRERSLVLVTVVGPPGLGKTRLADEFAREVAARTRVLWGRCRSYGEGLTFLPILDIVRQAIGADADPEGLTRALARLLPEGDEASMVARGLAAMLGGGGEARVEEEFWAARRLLEGLAARRPVLAMVDDLHCAEPTFLDLLEHLAARSQGAPILLVCLARDELHEVRPGWGRGLPRAIEMRLGPLVDDAATALVEQLLAGPVDPGVLARMVAAAGGIPLFAEEAVAGLVGSGRLVREDAGWVTAGPLDPLPIPPTLRALLASRIDELPDEERDALRRASVEGLVFHPGAVAALAEGTPEALDRALTALVRRDLVRPAAAQLAGQDAVRFRHELIRDAAYASVSKSDRAVMHRRLAGWLEAAAGDRAGEVREVGGIREIVGYHLETSFRLLEEIGAVDDDARAAARRAADLLGRGGRAALDRGDFPAADNLLGRAADLLAAEDPKRWELLPDLWSARTTRGSFGGAIQALDEAAAVEDAALRAQAALVRTYLELQVGGVPTEPAGGWSIDLERMAARLIPALQDRGDDAGLARIHRLLAEVHTDRLDLRRAERAAARAALHARRAGRPHQEAEALDYLMSSIACGPTPAPRAVARLGRFRLRAGRSRYGEAYYLVWLGSALALAGHFDEAQTMIRRGRDALLDLGTPIRAAGAGSSFLALAEEWAGDLGAAEEELRRAREVFRAAHDRGHLCSAAAGLGHLLLEAGRDGEAEPAIEEARSTVPPDDRAGHMQWRAARARLLAGRGAIDEAVALAREAAALFEGTDAIAFTASALADAVEALRLAGRADEAAGLGALAADALRQKEAVVVAPWLRRLVGVAPAPGTRRPGPRRTPRRRRQTPPTVSRP